MNQSSTSDGDGYQTIINTLAWMQTNIREGTYTRPSKYHRKSEEDVMAWCEEVDRVVAANNWRDGQIYTIVVAYLKGAVVDYYEEESINITG